MDKKLYHLEGLITLICAELLYATDRNWVRRRQLMTTIQYVLRKDVRGDESYQAVADLLVWMGLVAVHHVDRTPSCSKCGQKLPGDHPVYTEYRLTELGYKRAGGGVE